MKNELNISIEPMIFPDDKNEIASWEEKYKNDYWKLQREKAGSYRYCGIMIVVLTSALSVSVVERVLEDVRTHVPQGLFYGFMAFALIRIILAVYNFHKARKYDDLIVRAVRSINMTTALVSILTLQTAFFDAYFPHVNLRLLNAIIGTIICLCVVGLGIYMIVYSQSAKKRIEKNCAPTLKTENYDIGYNREDYKEEYKQAVLPENVDGNIGSR